MSFIAFNFQYTSYPEYGKITIEKRDKEGEYKEIYFTGYAQNLLDTSDVWGLVALGFLSNAKQAKVASKIDNAHYMNIISSAKQLLMDLSEQKRKLQDGIELQKEEIENAVQMEYGLNTESLAESYRQQAAEFQTKCSGKVLKAGRTGVKVYTPDLIPFEA